jgi:hypothetical protein
VQVDALAVRLRARAPLEAADLGASLCRSAGKSVYLAYLVVGVPVMALALATYEIRYWLPGLILWCIKPWLDRTILFVLARSAFGQRTTLSDLWHARWQVWGRQLFLTLTWRRLSPWRSFTQPVYQLEGHSFFRIRKRVLQIRGKRTGPALLMTSAFSLAETSLTLAVASLAVWFAPGDATPHFASLFTGEDSPLLALLYSVSYALVVLFLEPFYVSAGFAMYLSRRADLEAWDIEQEFRRAFAQ